MGAEAPAALEAAAPAALEAEAPEGSEAPEASEAPEGQKQGSKRKRLESGQAPSEDSPEQLAQKKIRKETD